MIRIRNFVLFAAAVVIAGNAVARAADERPNFVIMIADDVSQEDIGAYGHPHIRTPNVDALAKNGLRFDAAFLTCSSCSPSRCSINTGRYPHATGAAELHQPLPEDQITFAELLKQAGYYTAAAGKWHMGPHAKRGYDTVIEGGGASGCSNWVKVLHERPQDKPFFLWLASFDAHRGYVKNTIDKPHTNDDVVVPPFLPDVPDTRGDLAMYYDEITRLDGFVGDVMQELKSQGVADNTLVIFMADNGRPFPRCKTTVYDSGVCTPFVVQWPAKVKPGGKSSSLVSSIDIAPTFLELAGVKPSDTFQGVSFAPILSDPKAKTRDFIFAEHNWHDYQAHKRAIRSGDLLYIRNAFPELTGSPPADAVRSPTYAAMQKLAAEGKLPPVQRDCFIAPRAAEELFDLSKDRDSLQNVVGDPAYARQLAQLRSGLDQWIKETDDRVPSHPTPDKFDRQTGKGIRR